MQCLLMLYVDEGGWTKLTPASKPARSNRLSFRLEAQGTSKTCS